MKKILALLILIAFAAGHGDSADHRTQEAQHILARQRRESNRRRRHRAHAIMERNLGRFDRGLLNYIFIPKESGV